MGRVKKQPKKKYTQQQLFSAIQAVKNGSSQFAAAKRFSIPRSTLFNKITGKTLLGKKPGPSTVLLPEEEVTIERWVFGLATRGFPVTKRQLLRSIQLYLNINKRKTVFKNNLPGRKWYDSFRERHPQISEKLSQNLTARRAAVTAENLRAWHAEILKHCNEHELMDALNDPSRVFNMDEKGFVLAPKNEVVLVKRGDKAAYKRSKNDEKECVTALLGGSASGKMTPPMMIHSYKRMPAAVLLNNPAKWSVGISETGWQTQQTFYEYMTNIFYKWLLEEKVQFPVILFIDGHKSHVSLTLSEFCATNKIELIALYPNSTHLTQPMDVGVFKPLNNSWENQLEEWKTKNQFSKIERKDVAPILEKAINPEKYGEHLKSAFRKSGIFPFDVENIEFSRILPPITATDSQEQLWNEEATVPTIAEPFSGEKNVPVDRLQHFESLMGNSVLNSFRKSAGVWTGSKEYSILFTIWKQMSKEAEHSTKSPNPITDTMSTETSDSTVNFESTKTADTIVNSMSAETSVPIVLEVECIDQVPENVSMDGVVQFENWQDGDNSTCLSDRNLKKKIVWSHFYKILFTEIDYQTIVDLDSISIHDDIIMEIVDVSDQNTVSSDSYPPNSIDDINVERKFFMLLSVVVLFTIFTHFPAPSTDPHNSSDANSDDQFSDKENKEPEINVNVVGSNSCSESRLSLCLVTRISTKFLLSYL